MYIKKLFDKDYTIIKKLLKSNNSKLPSIESWKSFKDLTLKNKSFVRDGLFKDKKLIGYHSYIIKFIVFKKKKYKVLISSNLNVSKQNRNGSFILINDFFRKNCDIFLTTTANKNSSKIWQFFKGVGVNDISTKYTIYQITDYSKWIENFLIKKKITFIPKFLINFFGVYFKFYYKPKIKNNSIDYKLNFKMINKNSLLLEKFNKDFETKCKFPVEQRSNFFLMKYINSLELNKKKVFIIQVLDKKKMIGYFTLVKEKYENIDRIFLGELRILGKYEKYINEILKYAKKIGELNRCTYMFYKHLSPSLIRKIDMRNFFIFKQNFNPYILKLNTKKSYILRKYVKKKWKTSYFDGDCLL